MWKSTLRRILIAIPQLIVVSIIVFAIASIMPGDALGGMFGEDGTMDYETMRQLRIDAGLYDPMWERYIRWARGMLRLDFGQSLIHRRPVIELVGERLSNTMLLSTISVLMIYAFAVPVGLISGRFRGKLPDKIINFYNFIQMAFPMVVFAVILMWVFAILLQWFPLRGSVDVTIVNESWWIVMRSRINHAILPALSLSALAGVGIIQFLGNEVNDQKNLEYTTTAIGKGVPLNHVYTRHIFRNSLLPIAAGFGGIIVGLFGGAVIIENLFIFRGMGNLYVSAIGQRDWPVVNFLVMFYSTLTIVGFLISDIALTIFDPRIRIK